MIDKDKWLSGRLTDARLTSDIWTQLFEAIEELWGEMVFPSVERLKYARKTFTQDREALARLMNELGDVFEVPIAMESYEQHLGILRRRWEVHRKRVQPMLQSLLERNFPGLGAVWQALYCPKDQSYSNANLVTIEQLNTDEKSVLNSHFLTSRGNISIFLPAFRWLMSKRGQDDKEILEAVYRQARRILPEHIVLEFLSLRDHADQHVSVIHNLHSPVNVAVIDTDHVSELTGAGAQTELVVVGLNKPVITTVIDTDHVSELTGTGVDTTIIATAVQKPISIGAGISNHASDLPGAGKHLVTNVCVLNKAIAFVAGGNKL